VVYAHSRSDARSRDSEMFVAGYSSCENDNLMLLVDYLGRTEAMQKERPRGDIEVWILNFETISIIL
jgi:hypothetical protein